MSTLTRVAASALIASGPRYLHSVTAVGGTANAGTCTIWDDVTGTGVAAVTLSALTNTAASWHAGSPQGVQMSTGIYCTVGGTGCAVMIEFD